MLETISQSVGYASANGHGRSWMSFGTATASTDDPRDPEVIVDAAAVERGKPSPGPYLLAAGRFGVAPEHCLVVEDAPSGVQAGLRAGMTVWNVNTPVAVDGAHRHFRRLRDAVDDIMAFASGGWSGVTAKALPPAVDPGQAEQTKAVGSTAYG